MNQKQNKLSLLCPCCSGNTYAECCQPYHQGFLPPNALALMRSRYTAYAYSQAAYIILTTHPDNPQYQKDQARWILEILGFCQNTLFRKLDILEFIDGDSEAYVSFIAHLSQQGQKLELREKSRFVKQGPRWLYHSAV